MSTIEGASAVARLLDGDALDRTMRRLAHEVTERHPGAQRLVLAGIRDGGVPIALELAALMAGGAASRPRVLGLDAGGHRDDRPRRPRTTNPLVPVDGAGGEVPITGAVVVVVDDVVHTGRTLRAALDALADCGRPAAVEALVVVDRGRRELPLRATYVGRNLPVAPGDWVDVVMSDMPGSGRGAYLRRRL